MRRGLVKLEARNGDEFGGVRRVLRVLSSIAGDTLRKIASAHDDKGELSVWWGELPYPEDMARVERAWLAESEITLSYKFADGSSCSVIVDEPRPGCVASTRDYTMSDTSDKEIRRYAED